ncbi:MAG: YceI family protein [Gammaproteobacteria bacterium]
MFIDYSDGVFARFLAGVGLIAVLLLGPGCQRVPPVEAPGAEPELSDVPALPVEDSLQYRIDRDNSELRILVFRGGPLAEFGHNHVIVAENISGDVYLPPEFHHSGFRLRIPVSGFSVDPPSARKEEGGVFAKELSGQARDATAENMLGPDVLDAENHPVIQIRSVAISGPDWGPDITVRITLRGISRDITVPVAVERNEDRLRITGTMELKQTDFGITPFSAMGGGLRVQDRLKIRFRIKGVRVD